MWVTYISGTCNSIIFLLPTPWGGVKRSNIIKSQSQSQFQRFLNQTLGVFLQLNDIKHIRQDFHSVAWVMPQAGDLGVLWGVGRPKTFFSNFNQGWCVRYLHECHMQRHNFLGPCLLGPWGGFKRSNIIKSQLHLKSNSKIFKLNFVCLLTNERYKTYKTGFSFGPLGHACPRVWDLGGAEGSKI